MGLCVINKEYKKKYIQTPECRSPELLLRLGYDEKTDIWALGCTAYELACGYPMIDFSNNPNNPYDEERYQLKLITEIIGPIPDDMINNSPHKEIFFTHDKHIKGIKNLDTKKLVELQETLEKRGNTKKDILLFIDMMLRMLTVNPTIRPSAGDILGHHYFL